MRTLILIVLLMVLAVPVSALTVYNPATGGIQYYDPESGMIWDPETGTASWVDSSAPPLTPGEIARLQQLRDYLYKNRLRLERNRNHRR